MGAAWAGRLFFDVLEMLQRWKHASVALRRPGFEKPEGLTQMLNDGLVAGVGDLAMQVLHAVNQGANYLLTVCAGVVTDVARVARALALNKDQHLRAMTRIGFGVEHVEHVDVAGV
jgi:hypothetical protein